MPDRPSLEALRKCALEMDVCRMPIGEYVSFTDKGYKRNVVHVSSKCEVTVLCFLEGQITPVHDHGGSLGITAITEGTMTEEFFIKQPSGVVVPTTAARHPSGAMSCIDVSTIHRVSNIRQEGLITINVYFPPLVSMNLYTPGSSQSEKWVTDYRL
jgi:predicted metal-dependent enzyme (double-stranded beta helix superfamily)